MQAVYKPEYYDFLYEKSSRNRILMTAKTLFASLGYDNTSTASIARNAGTSESQLMKHFGGKAGLLDAIFSEGWERINKRLAECFEASQDLSCVPEVVFAGLERDPELRTLVVLEGHRMRENRSAYRDFLRMIDRAIGDDSLPARSALVGMIEGTVRDEVLGLRQGNEGMGEVFRGFLAEAIKNPSCCNRQAEDKRIGFQVAPYSRKPVASTVYP